MTTSSTGTRPIISTDEQAAINVALWVNRNDKGLYLSGTINGSKTFGRVSKRRTDGSTFLAFSDANGQRDANGYLPTLAYGNMEIGEDGKIFARLNLQTNKEEVKANFYAGEEEAIELGYVPGQRVYKSGGAKSGGMKPQAPKPAGAKPAQRPVQKVEPAPIENDYQNDDDIPF